jgi:hypothetical protein
LLLEHLFRIAYWLPRYLLFTACQQLQMRPDNADGAAAKELLQVLVKMTVIVVAELAEVEGFGADVSFSTLCECAGSAKGLFAGDTAGRLKITCSVRVLMS